MAEKRSSGSSAADGAAILLIDIEEAKLLRHYRRLH
jgi:hypothetical protein